VVWSSSQQEGYMRFENLAPNDPAKNQYQLWIFDPTRADWEAKPVDGGVFDVAPDGTSVVPIDPKLDVRETALFAVTLEVPGGVVVSEREHLVLTAAL
jgi:anti-sigma-K factor RskA